MRPQLLACLVVFIALIYTLPVDSAQAYGQSSYYSQGNYYSQPAYYTQASYSDTGSYPAVASYATSYSWTGLTRRAVLQNSAIQAGFTSVQIATCSYNGCSRSHTYYNFATPRDGTWYITAEYSDGTRNGWFTVSNGAITASSLAGLHCNSESETCPWAPSAGMADIAMVSATRLSMPAYDMWPNMTSLTITSTTPPPYCSVTADTNPISYGNTTTLRWFSFYADSSLYINNIGYVTSNTFGSSVVGPLTSTSFNGSAIGPGGTTPCDFTLTVAPPATCTFDGSPVAHGGSVTAYESSSVPDGQTCANVSETRTCTNGTLSGTYTNASCNVAPSCSVSVSPDSLTQGQSSTLTWSSSNATSCTGNNFSTGGATSGDTSVNPSQTTTYTASCTGDGGTTQCTGTGAGGIGGALSVSCTPSYTCTGPDSQTITYTDDQCATSSIDTCESPENFCSAGSASCLTLNPTGWISASPRLVISGAKSQITWSTSDTVSCSVTGNGDTWTGTSGSQESRPITFLATYTLACDDNDADATQDDLIDSVTILRIPGWKER